MRFAYREYIGRLPGSSDFALILRPVISVTISGPHSTARWDALVDTGADETLLPMSLAEALGVELDPRLTSQAAGISGEVLRIHYGDVDFQIEAGADSISWSTMVGFVEFSSSKDEVIVLGHGGCLDYFTAIFDGEHAELELIPNSTLPSIG
jgi:predicted aspartyl protease